MAITNPYDPAEQDAGAPQTAAFYWRIPFLCLAAIEDHSAPRNGTGVSSRGDG